MTSTPFQKGQFLREGVKKPISCGHAVGGDGMNPQSATFDNKYFFSFLKREKDAECSETEYCVFCKKNLVIKNILSKTF